MVTLAFEDLRALHDTGAVYASLSQLLLKEGVAERLGDQYDYAADLRTDSLVFRSQESSATIGATVELIASVAPGPQTMRWGRTLPNGGRACAQMLLDRGHADGLPSLLNDEVPFPCGDDPNLSAEYAALEIGAVVTAVTGGGLTYIVGVGGGTIAVLLLSGFDFTQPRIDHRFFTSVSLAFGAGTVEDHRSAIDGLATMSGWSIEWSKDRRHAALSDPVTGNGATAEFDEHGRLTALQGSLS